jgi:hypothetical protein
VCRRRQPPVASASHTRNRLNSTVRLTACNHCARRKHHSLLSGRKRVATRLCGSTVCSGVGLMSTGAEVKSPKLQQPTYLVTTLVPTICVLLLRHLSCCALTPTLSTSPVTPARKYYSSLCTRTATTVPSTTPPIHAPATLNRVAARAAMYARAPLDI